jgi:hypothetical protein
VKARGKHSKNTKIVKVKGGWLRRWEGKEKVGEKGVQERGVEG